MKKAGMVMLKILISAAVIYCGMYAWVITVMMLTAKGLNDVVASIAGLLLPCLILALIWFGNKRRVCIVWLICAAVCIGAAGINYAVVQHEKSITINTAPNIRTQEYLPFDENSKIVKARSEKLNFTENIPVIDGAAALFPVYSAFVNATYPENTVLSHDDDGVFVYNNTLRGYELLAEKKTDIFIGAYPNEEQRIYAQDNDTTYEYTPIGKEAFVFFVHKDNPIVSLSTEEIKGIYSGKITNWSEVGGKNEEIVAFQRNEGSGSQSMLERFMGEVPIMEAPKDKVNDLMSGIIEKVSDYKSKGNSIGFSFRYYVEGIIKNPDIKMIAIDGAMPTVENIKNGTYPIVTEIYAVTYTENENENVKKFTEWMLSEEGQYIIEKTGYVGN